VTGEPIAACTIKFGAAQKQIEALGFEAVNPLELVNIEGGQYNVALNNV
jgi:hypothetical protein